MTVVFVISCGTSSTIGQKSDMTGYPDFADTDHVFIDSNVKDVVNRYQKGETFAVFFGFSNCPWCREAMPLLNEVAKENGRKVYYVNTRAKEGITSNTEIDDYDLLVENLGEFFPYDNDGIRHLYVPFVFFIKDGVVVSYHEGTTDDHDATERKMTPEEQDELISIYEEGFYLMN